MKLKPANRLFPILVMGIFMSVPAIGQDQEERTPMEIDASLKDIRDPEPGESESKTESKVVSKPISTISVLRDSVSQTKFVKPASKSTDKSQKSEDPLSFNFLYYIIEKFKMSDMIE